MKSNMEQEKGKDLSPIGSDLNTHLLIESGHHAGIPHRVNYL